MLTALLALMLCAKDDPEVTLTVYLVKATQEERGGADAALKFLEDDLKELGTFNRFEIAGSATIRVTALSEEARTQIALRDTGRFGLAFTPHEALDGRVRLKGLTLSEEVTEDEVVISGGVTVKTTKKRDRAVFRTTVYSPENRLTIAGSTVVETKSGPVTVVVVVKAKIR